MGAVQGKMTLRRVEQNDPGLTKLSLSNSLGFVPTDVEGLGIYWPKDGSDLVRIGVAIGSNSQLRILNIRNTDRGCLDVMAASGDFMDALEYNTAITGLWLVNFQLVRGIGRDMLKHFVANHINLTEVRLTTCDLMNGGTDVLTSAAARCPNLTDIKLVRCDVNNEVLAEFVSGIAGMERLRSLELPMNIFGRDGCEALSTLLRNPNCNLQYLDLRYNFLIDDICAIHLANSMKANRKLKSLILIGCEITRSGWGAFDSVLCNTSSVSGTHLSNHVLQDLGDVHPPSNLSALLDLNCIDDKNRVSALKILLHHTHLDMKPFHSEWDLKMLPVAVSWFDRAKGYARYAESNFEAKKLSAIYQFAKALPMMIVPLSKMTKLMKEKFEHNQIK